MAVVLSKAHCREDEGNGARPIPSMRKTIKDLKFLNIFVNQDEIFGSAVCPEGHTRHGD